MRQLMNALRAHPLLKRAKVIIRYGVVGVSGVGIDFVIYNLLIIFLGIHPAVAKVFSTEAGILNNFVWNNRWTFKERNTAFSTKKKLILFNIISLGGLIIGVGVIKVLTSIYGQGILALGPVHISYYNIYFLISVPPSVTWNFILSHFLAWKKISSKLQNSELEFN